MTILEEISVGLQKGKAKDVCRLVEQAIQGGLPASDILNQGLLPGMDVVGRRFKNNEIFVPEVLMSARAMSMGTLLLKPLLTGPGVKSKGRVVIGTVKGDRHDIGKNLVKMMMEGKGLEVIDLGVDVSPEQFFKTARERQCRIVACSALLTTTMHVMKDVVTLFEREGLRDSVRIMVGGAPVTEEFCKEIGADAYTPDAASAAEVAVRFCG